MLMNPAIFRNLQHCFFVESLQLLNRSRRAGSQRPAAVPPFREWRQEVETKNKFFPHYFRSLIFFTTTQFVSASLLYTIVTIPYHTMVILSQNNMSGQ